MSILLTAPVQTQIHYPDSDGKPMAETDIHRDILVGLIEGLKGHFRDAPDVYISGNLLVYYEEGNPQAVVAPDVFVVMGVAKRLRRIYKIWEEGKAPDVVFEITSRSTREEDIGTKLGLYARLGVREYFLFDPLGEYLHPRLRGYRLAGKDLAWMEPGADGELQSQVLGLELWPRPERLELIDLETGESLLVPAELQLARRAAEERAEEAEAELARLRAELARLRGE